MQYHGPLFGHIPGTRKYFDTGKTSKDWDNMEAERDRLKAALQTIVQTWDRESEACADNSALAHNIIVAARAALT